MTMFDRILQAVKPMVPMRARPAVRRLHRGLRRVYFLPVDLYCRLRGRDEFTPPPSLIFIGDGDFRAIGEEFAQYFTTLAGLKPDDHVLDIGCGVGRMAVPLTKVLSPGGRYHGFDIVKEGIEWAQKTITPRFPNFAFHHADIHNKGYNPAGQIRTEEYRFPSDDGVFDLVFSASVLTHLLLSDLEHYLAETSRLLKAGGTCLHTFFLLNDESGRLIKAGSSTLDFRFELPDGAWTTDRVIPENAIAYPESLIRTLYARHGLEIREPIRFGRWSGRKEFLSYQDIVIARKKPLSVP
jgi:SAM-dependent methyltransferase